jgi:hypothetical protein
VVEYKNRIPFEVDLHDKLTPSMYGTADTLFRTLQYGFFDFEQHQHVQFADLLGKASAGQSARRFATIPLHR